MIGISSAVSDGEILEVNQVCCYFNYVNRLLNGLGISLEGDKVDVVEVTAHLGRMCSRPGGTRRRGSAGRRVVNPRSAQRPTCGADSFRGQRHHGRPQIGFEHKTAGGAGGPRLTARRRFHERMDKAHFR